MTARMSKKTSNTLKFLTIGLLASTAAINPSQAAVHEAQTEWAMNRVASVASGSYCTVAQKFDDQSILTLAKNQSGEYSLAFDFTRPYFPDAKATKITLQPAGGQAQSFDVKPQTDKLVVIGIGPNEGFINALKNSGKLDMKIGGQTKTFNTNKFADAAAELTDCVSTMKAPATSLAAAAPAPNSAQAMEARETPKAATKEPAARVSTSRVSTQSQAVAQAPTAVANIEPAADAPKVSTSRISQQQPVQQPVQLAESAALKASETATPAMAIAAAPVATAPRTQRIDQTAIRENEALKQQMAQMQSELQQAKTVAAEASKPVPATVRVDQTAIRENEALKQQMAQLDAALKESQAERAALAQKSAEVESANQQVATLQSQLIASNENLAKLQQDLKAAQTAAATPKPSPEMIAELEKAKADLAAAQAQNQTLQTQAAQAATASQQVSALQAQIAASNNNLAKMQQQLQAAQAAAATPKPSPEMIAELEKAKADLAAAQAQNQTLQTQAAQAATASLQVSALQSQIAASNDNLAKMQQQLQAAQAAAAAPKPSPEMIAELEKAKADLAAAQTQNQSLQAQAAEAAKAQQTVAMTSQQMAELQKQNEELKAQVAASSQSVAQIQSQLQAAQAQAAKTPEPTPEMIAEMNKLKADLTAAQAKSQQLEAQSAQASQAMQASAKTSEEVAELQRQNKALQELINQSNKSTVELQAKLDAAQAQANKEATPSPAVIAELEKAKAELASAKAENQKLQEQSTKSAQALTANAAAAPQMAELQKQNEALKAQIAETNKTIADMQVKLAQAPKLSVGAPVAQPAASEATLKENQALKIQLSKLEHELRASRDVAAIAPAAGADTQTAKELTQLRAQMDIVQKENTQLKAQMENLQSNTDAGQIKAASNNWDLEQATRRYQESQREIRRLAALIETQQQQFEKEKKETEAMLFDPAITEKAQQEKLDQLQARIDQLEAGGAVAPQEVAMAPVTSQRARQVPVARVEQQSLGNIDDMPEEIAPAAGVEMPEAEASLPVPHAVTKPEAARKIAPVIQANINESPKPMKAMVTPVTQVSFQSRENFEQILNSSGINIRGGVEEMKNTSTAGYRAYRWKTDSLFGSAEQRAMKGGQGFEAAVQQYLDRAESRCGGDFAAMPSDVTTMADKSKAYEIACIGGNTNTSASVLFTYGNDVMMTIAHEGKAEAMDMAMEAKDRIAGKIGSMKTASR